MPYASAGFVAAASAAAAWTAGVAAAAGFATFVAVGFAAAAGLALLPAAGFFAGAVFVAALALPVVAPGARFATAGFLEGDAMAAVFRALGLGFGFAVALRRAGRLAAALAADAVSLAAPAVAATLAPFALSAGRSR